MDRSTMLKQQSTGTMKSATYISSRAHVEPGRRSGERSENARCLKKETTAKIHTITGSGPAEGVLSPISSGRVGAFGLAGLGHRLWKSRCRPAAYADGRGC